MTNKHGPNGVWCKRDIPLRSVLKGWVHVTEELARKFLTYKDVPWWYNERTDVSILAGGVWRSGGRALEEFSGTKRKIGKNTGHLLHRAFPGRVDMYLETHDGHKFYLEAKSCYSGAKNSGKDPRPRLREWLDWACGDVKTFHPHGCGRLGVVFVKPYIECQSGYPSVEDVKRKISD